MKFSSPHPHGPQRPIFGAWGVFFQTALGAALGASAQASDHPPAADNALREVVVTDRADPGPGTVADPATRGARWPAPATVDVLDGRDLRDGQTQVQLSESVGRVPGLLVRSRQNQAQELQLSVRGAGARASFGVRGVRLLVDGLPASGPDGQGQVANFPLGSADRLEVVRGPFAALYGASSAAVISLTTEEGGLPASGRTGAVVGPDGLWRLSTQATGHQGDLRYALDLSRYATDGLRPQSAAERGTAHLKLTRPYADGRVVFVANRLADEAQDPLGLSRAEFDADPRQTTASARLFNTRKATEQTQLGVAWQHRLNGGHHWSLAAHAGDRGVLQHQAIPAASQAAPTSPGGVIDLARRFAGWSARWRWDHAPAEGPHSGRLSLEAGLTSEQQTDDRRGFNNFSGTSGQPTALGVTGALRRDDRTQAHSLDPHALAEWSQGDWVLAAGVRFSRLQVGATDRFVAPGNPDDGGATRYSGTTPVLGLRWRLAEAVQAFASAGLGLETPTLNELAYQASGASGLNTALRASRSENLEAGLRGRHGHAGWTATAFRTDTRDDIVVLTNAGGRASFGNAGRTRRQGLELSGDLQWRHLQLSAALTQLDARYRDGFDTCTAVPCLAPNLFIPAGNRLPGVPERWAHLQLAWQPLGPAAIWTLEARHIGTVTVNDRQSDAAAGHTLLHLAARFEQRHGPWRLRQFARVDNIAQRRHAGSVIVNEASGRYFEPGPGRQVSVGLELVRRFD